MKNIRSINCMGKLKGFICEMQNSNMTLLEHKAAKWLNKGELDTVDWLPADLWVVEKLKEAVQRKPKA